MGGRFLAFVLAAATVALIVIGTIWPIPSAAAYAGITGPNTSYSTSTPEGAVDDLAHTIGQQNWGRAYSLLNNKSEFTQQQFISDIRGSYPGLRTYATLDTYEAQPLRASGNEAEVRLRLRW